MPTGFQIGRLFGTDIYMSPNFLLLLALYFLIQGLENAWLVAAFAVALIVSLLVHEFGHVAAVKKLLRTDCWVLLWAFGGLCMWRPTGDRSPRKRILVALAGPAFQIPLAIPFLYLWLTMGRDAAPVYSAFVSSMVWINVFWFGVNLLPLLPLDGGHALQAALEFFWHPIRAEVVAARISVVTAVAAGAVALSYGFLFATILCALLLARNLAVARKRT